MIWTTARDWDVLPDAARRYPTPAARFDQRGNSSRRDGLLKLLGSALTLFRRRVSAIEAKLMILFPPALTARRVCDVDLPQRQELAPDS